MARLAMANACPKIPRLGLRLPEASENTVPPSTELQHLICPDYAMLWLALNQPHNIKDSLTRLHLHHRAHTGS